MDDTATPGGHGDLTAPEPDRSEAASSLESTLTTRLQRAATEFEPNTDAALEATLRRLQDGRRGRVGAAVLAAAASVAIVAGAAFALANTEPAQQAIDIDPAGRAQSGQGSVSTLAPILPVPADQADATLVIYRLPFATPEMIAADPKMAEEWAMLFTADRVYYSNGPLADLGDGSTSVPSNLAGALHAIDKVGATESQPETAAEALARSGFIGFGDPESADLTTFGSDAQFVGLTELLATGTLNTAQADLVSELLYAMPGVESDPTEFQTLGEPPLAGSSGSAFFASRSADAYLFFDPETANPLRKGSIQVPDGSMEYVSVTPVRASEILVPGRGNDVAASTSTTITLPEDLPTVESPESTTTTHPWPSIAGS